MVCVSWAFSGSGKSTLVHDVLYNALISRQGLPAPRAEYERVEGDQQFSEIVLVDQSPLGRTPRSNPVTYIKAFDVMRDVFASTSEARTTGTPRDIFPSTFPADAVRPARAMAR